MAPSYSDSLAIYKAFQEKDLPLFIAYYRRSLPRFDQIRVWLEKGAIGTVRSLKWQLLKPASALDHSRAYNWRTDVKVAPGGYFDDLASHGLDLFCYLLGPIVEAKGVAVNQQGLYSGKDAVTACWVHGRSWEAGTFLISVNFPSHRKGFRIAGIPDFFWRSQ